VAAQLRRKEERPRGGKGQRSEKGNHEVKFEKFTENGKAKWVARKVSGS
jgi:hypothetical protein